MSLDSLLEDLNNRKWKDERAEQYHEASRTERNVSPMTPPELRQLHTKLPWCRLCVSVLEERLDIREISSPDVELTEYLVKVWKHNNADEKASKLATDAMEYGRSYLVITAGDDLPLMQVVSGRQMVHRINVYTGQVEEALRVYGDKGDRYAHYSPGKISYYIRNNGQWVHDPEAPKNEVESSDQVPVFPFLSRAEIDDRWGRPEAKDIWSLQDAATRAATDLTIAGSLMALPQRILTGVEEGDLTNPDGTRASKDKIYMGRLLTLASETAGIHEFSAAQLQNYTTSLNAMTRQAAALMGVPLSVFGVSSDANPTSGDAQRQDDMRLVRRVERIARGFTPSWLAALRYIADVYGDFGPDADISVIWVPPAEPTLQARADAVLKLSAVKVDANSLYSRKALLLKLGETGEFIKQMLAEQDERDNDVVNRLMRGADGDAPTPTSIDNSGDDENAS